MLRILSLIIISLLTTVQAEAADTEADIQRLIPRSDGSLWLLTSRGDRGQPAGVLVTDDGLDHEGNFVRRVAVECEGSADRDALSPLEDGRFVLVKSHADAMATMRGTDTDAADASIDDAPLEIVGLRAVETP